MAVSLGLTIVTALGYLAFMDRSEHKNRHALLAQSNRGDNPNLLMAESIQERGTDNRQTVIRTYGLVRNALHSILKLPDKSGQTERELIVNLKSKPLLIASSDTLGRIYSVYEQVRFGGANISERNLEFFLKDVRSLSGLRLDS